MYKGKNNVWMTKSLFWDMWVNTPITHRYCDPVFTFDSDRDFEGRELINFKRSFIELGDPTGYEWAMKYLDSFDHFQYLLQRGWFKDEYERAKAELHTKLRAGAIKEIAAIATGGGNEAQKLAAAKYLAESGWEKNTRGRPSKAELKGEVRRLAEAASAEDDDLNRMQLTVIQGGK